MFFYIEMNGAPFVKKYDSISTARRDVARYCQAWNIQSFKILNLEDAICIYGAEELAPLISEVV